LLLFCAVCAFWMISAAPADALDPRDLIAAPAGTKGMIYYYY